VIHRAKLIAPSFAVVNILYRIEYRSIHRIYIVTAAKLVYLFSKFRRFLNVEQSLNTYKSIIRPVLEYCPSILLATSDKNTDLIERLQNRVIRVIVQTPSRFSITNGRRFLNLSTLKSGRIYLFNKFVYKKFKLQKCAHLLITLSQELKSHQRSLRAPNSLIKPFYRTSHGQTCFLRHLYTHLTNFNPTSAILSFDY
jgi:hypothetical protein